MGSSWTNWAATVQATPERSCHPATVADVQSVVRHAPGRVKAVGAGHSFTGVAVTDGTHVHLDRLAGVLEVDLERHTATVAAGTRLADLNAHLWDHGLAMRNLGDIDVQTLAGAIGTGTHGTGAHHTGIAAQVIALDLVTADGELLHCAPGSPELEAARIGLGALGVVTRVTLQCEPAFLLRAVERPAGLDATLDGFTTWIERHDHAEFYWFPHTRRVLTKANDRVPGPPRPLHRARSWFDDELMSNAVFDGLNRFAAVVPAAIPRLNQISARALSARTYVDRSYRVFCSPRRVVFREMEYAVPRSALTEVLTGIDAWLRHSDERIAFPVEVRVAAADDVWLSTAYGRDTAYVAVHQYVLRDYRRYFDAVEAICRASDGRPHWGKLHTRTSSELDVLYPRLADFRAVRDRLDPDRRFANPYLEQVLGR